MRRVTVGGRIVRAYAWAVVTLRWVVVVAWVAAAVVAWVAWPPLGGAGAAPLVDVVPADAPALRVQLRAFELFGSTPATDTVLVQRNPRGLAREEIQGHLRGAAALAGRGRPPGLERVRAAVPLVNVPVEGADWPERGTTALTYLFLDPDASVAARNRAAEAYRTRFLRAAPGSTLGTTGAGPARLAQFEAIEDRLPLVEGATVAVILLLVALAFRSWAAPLVTLLTAVVAYVVAVRALGWLGQRSGTGVPAEVEPVLVVLLLGLVTDYTVFYVSEARRRLGRGDEPRVAARRATARITPIVLTAGVLVAGATASLVAGELAFFRGFGPALALAALVVTAVAVTLGPALVAVAGARLGSGEPGPVPDGEQEATGAPADAPPAADASAAPPRPAGRRRVRWAFLRGAWRASGREPGGMRIARFGARLAATRPVALVLVAVTVAGLGTAAAGAGTIDLTVSFVPSLPAGSEPRRAAEGAAAGFAPGIVAPTDLLLEGPGVADEPRRLAGLRAAIARERGVAVALGPGQADGTPLEGEVLAPARDAARIVVVLADEPTGLAAMQTLDRLRARLPALLAAAGLPAGTRTGLAGETALAADTIDAIQADLFRVAFAIAVVTFGLLALFLRSLVAPALLLAASILGFAASLGIAALVLGTSSLVYYVPLVAGVLLVGLGSDYNVFIAGRIRAEARHRRLGEAIAVAAPSASKGITIAGITLASTFALLWLVPLRPFRELAAVLAIGVLVDALLVRPLLIPSLIALTGRASWWPGRLRRPPAMRAFLAAVAARSRLEDERAEPMTVAVLAVLGERLPAREAHELGEQLPDALAVPLLDARGPERRFGADAFVARVAERTGVPPAAARDGARAVLSTLLDQLPREETDYVRAALPADYADLLGDP